MFPLGFLYFHLLVFGFAYGIGLSIILVGVPIIILTLILISGAASLERFLARVLLHVDIPVSSLETDQTTWKQIKRLVTDRQTWTATFYLLSMFFISVVVFALLSSALLTAGSLLLTPFYYAYAPTSIYIGPTPVVQFTPELLFGWNNLLIGLQTTVRIEAWQITSLPTALLVAGIGAVLMIFVLQLCNMVAQLWGQYMRRMLRMPRYWRTSNW